MRMLGLLFIALFFLVRPVSASFEAYNDTAGLMGSAPNVTHYNGFPGGPSTGLLLDYASGSSTSVTATMNMLNVFEQSMWGSIPNAGTDANNVFSGITNLSSVASYVNNNSDWFYEVTFTGLDTTKYYEFVTTANRNESIYGGEGTDSRWTKFSISGADAFINSSSTGVTEITPDALQMNTGYNTVNGYVIEWSGIYAADGSFTVRSENVGAAGPGNPYKSYGIQAFKLTEAEQIPVVPEPISSVLFIAGGVTLGLRRFRKVTRN